MDQKDFSILFLINRVKTVFYFLLTRLKVYLFTIFSTIYFCISFNYLTSPLFYSDTNFVIENDKSNKLSDLSSIASIAGLNSSSLIDGGSLFQIDNIQELFVSSSMLKKTLLTEKTFKLKKQKLVNRFLHFENSKNIFFDIYNSNQITRIQDSIIKKVIKKIKKNHLIVSKPNRKTSIINVNFVHKDEIFSKEFNETLVQNVIDFYFEIKNKKSKQNINILKKQVDSIKTEIDKSIKKLAYLDEDVPNPNPLLKSNKIPSQIEMLNLQANTSIYAEVVKQFELAKVSQRNKSPIIQIIDGPVFPLQSSRWNLPKTLIYGLAFGFIFITLYYFILIFMERIKL